MGVKMRERNGSWWIFIDYKGQRKAVKVGSKAAAKAKAVDIEKALTTGKLNLNPPPPAPTLKVYSDKWMEGHVRNNLKPSTYRGYKLILEDHILPEFGDLPLDAITRDEIKAYCYRKLEEGRKKPKKLPDEKVDARLSGRSVSYHVRTLSAIFNSAIEDGILTANPAQRPGRFIKTGDRREKIDILTPGEGKLFLDAAKAHHARHYPLFAAALYTGARQGELLALQWNDIDWRGKFIEIRRANWEGHVSSPKSGKGRRVDLADHLAVILKEHRRMIAAEALGTGRAMPDWVFISEPRKDDDQGKVWGWSVLDAANLRKTFLLCLKKAGLRAIRFHDLRHTFASWLIGNGESLAYVKEQMGHHSIQITVDTYGHLIPGANRQAVNRLAAMVEKSATPAQPGGSRVEQLETDGSGTFRDVREKLEPTAGIEPATC